MGSDKTATSNDAAESTPKDDTLHDAPTDPQLTSPAPTSPDPSSSPGPSSSDPISGLETELADFWRRGRVRTRVRARAIDPRLDPSCYPLLTVLARHNSMPMSELVTAVGMEKSTVTRQIDAVVRLGLVERHPDPRDARARVVTLTEHGRERIDAVVASAVNDWRARLAQWDADDIRTLTNLMHRLALASENFDGR